MDIIIIDSDNMKNYVMPYKTAMIANMIKNNTDKLLNGKSLLFRRKDVKGAMKCGNWVGDNVILSAVKYRLIVLEREKVFGDIFDEGRLKARYDEAISRDGDRIIRVDFLRFGHRTELKALKDNEYSNQYDNKIMMHKS